MMSQQHDGVAVAVSARMLLVQNMDCVDTCHIHCMA